MNVFFSNLVLLLVTGVWLAGCERTPEDLEPWRDAEGGYEKLAEWAASPEESEAVRVRAVQILIEEGQANDLQPLFDEKIADAAQKAKLVAGTLPTIEKLWKSSSLPTLDEKAKEEGQMINVDQYAETVKAVDAAYFLQPYAEGEAQSRLESILAEWVSSDQEFRDLVGSKIGKTTIGQILPRAGQEGQKAVVSWVATTSTPATVARQIRDRGGESSKAAVAKAIADRAIKEHPKLSPEMEVAVIEADHEAIVPYLEKAIEDDATPPSLADGAMDALLRIRGERASTFFAKLVANTSGTKRWVAATRLIESRGSAGVLQAVNALPLQADEYQGETEDSFKKDTAYFCELMKTELSKQDVSDISTVVKQVVNRPRWPAQVVGLRCIDIHGLKTLKEEAEKLTDVDQPVPNWGESKTLGEYASEVATKLSS